MTSSPPRLVVGAVIRDADGRVLVARRTRPAALRGRYEFPGGKVEQGESPVDALVREIAEELAVGLHVGPEVAGGPWMIDDQYRLRLWWGTVDAAPQPGDSHDLVVWCPLGELGGIDLLDSDTAALPAVIAGGQ